MLQTDFAVYIGIVYSYLPFMILPLYANLEKHDQTLLEAAADLGARPITAFLRITLPQSMPGIIAGSLLVFIPAVGEYVIPSLLGRTDQLMIGRVLSDEFFENRDWPVASAVAIFMLVAAGRAHHAVPAFRAADPGGAASEVARPVLAHARWSFGLVFLYVPILSMIVFSFNNSRLVTVWDSANSPTLKWYGALMSNGQILGAAWLSIQIAVVAATGAVDSRHAGRRGAGAVRRVPRPGTACRDDYGAARHARGDHRACRCCCCSLRWSRRLAGPRAAARSRSRSRTSPSAWPT